MAQAQVDQWPDYTFIVPHIYTRAKARLIGLGSYMPAGIITNDFFAYVATRLGDPRSADDLEHATGLSTRHVRASTLELCRKIAGKYAPGLIDSPEAPADESLVDMAVIAARRALAGAGRETSEVDTIIGASSSDNYVFPSMVNYVQSRLGMRPIRATMLKGACAGQTEAFQMGAEILTAGSARTVLIVTTEGLLSNVMHVLDWRLSSLFGEGAAAFLLERSDEESYVINGYDTRLGSVIRGQTPLRKDVIDMAEVDMKILQLFQQGKSEELNHILSQFLVGYAKMDGKAVFREAPRAMAESVDVLLRHAGLSYDELTYIVPHQANSRMTHRLGELLIRNYGWPSSTMEKLVDNFRFSGNLSNASIATSLVELLRQERLHERQWIALPAVGAGLGYGCWLLRFHELKNPQAALQV
ncbi:MAG: 3-oxoacyl-ACP synthase III family protein [Ktedonobacteraceae bacterium]